MATTIQRSTDPSTNGHKGSEPVSVVSLSSASDQKPRSRTCAVLRRSQHHQARSNANASTVAETAKPTQRSTGL